MTAGVRNIIWCDAVNPSIHQSMNPVLLAVFVVNVGPSVYIFGIKQTGKISLILGVVQFLIALTTFFFFSLMPLGGLFGSYLTKNTRQYVASQTFTASYPRLQGNDMWMSYGLWIMVFGAKLVRQV